MCKNFRSWSVTVRAWKLLEGYGSAAETYWCSSRNGGNLWFCKACYYHNSWRIMHDSIGPSFEDPFFHSLASINCSHSGIHSHSSSQSVIRIQSSVRIQLCRLLVHIQSSVRLHSFTFRHLFTFSHSFPTIHLFVFGHLFVFSNSFRFRNYSFASSNSH